MKTTHTNTFVGGPADGRVQQVEGERAFVEIFERQPITYATPERPEEKTRVNAHVYERSIFQTETEEFLFWRHKDLSYADAVRSLFERYAA